MEIRERFKKYLIEERSMARTSLSAYLYDYNEFNAYMRDHKHKPLREAGHADVVSYLMYLRESGRSQATINRKLAALRSLFQMLIQSGEVAQDPTLNIKSPRLQRKAVEFLSVKEVEKLLEQPDDSTKGIRDRALLELLYASGLRVSEISMANLSDLNLRIGFITCTGQHGKARVIPIGRPARAALETYVYEGRETLLRDKKDDGALFLNYAGDRISRQGVWKLLKEYAQKAGLESKLSPQILRNSFAAHMIQNGADIKSLQDLLGHEDITATQIFVSVTKNRIMDVYDKTHPRA